MVFAGLFPTDADQYPDLRDALEKLKLNDGSLFWEPETSQALGFGFRCGFLGLLHMEIVRERLEREFDLDLLVTTPNVAYQVHTTAGRGRRGPQPVADAGRERDRGRRGALRAGLGDRARRSTSARSWSSPRTAAASSTTWSTSRESRVQLVYLLPLAEIVLDFYDQLKSRTRGYASFDYELDGFRSSHLVKLDILLNGESGRRALDDRPSGQAPTRRARSSSTGCAASSRDRCSTCRSRPRSAARIIARETIKARRKDVLAKCYGGDVTRKRKLLEKQKKGKKRMKQVGTVEVPQEAFLAVLSLDGRGSS